MAEGIIRAVSQGGVRRRLLMQASAMLVDRHDRFSVEIHDAGLTINIQFSDDGAEYGMTGTASDDGKVLDLICHRWNNPQYVENVKPLEFTIDSTGKIWWVKIRSSADVSSSFRAIEVSVWMQE